MTTQLQLVPTSRKRGSLHLLPHTPTWSSVELVKYMDNFTLLVYFFLYGRTEDCRYEVLVSVSPHSRYLMYVRRGNSEAAPQSFNVQSISTDHFHF
jgi:hypothetical protein